MTWSIVAPNDKTGHSGVAIAATRASIIGALVPEKDGISAG
jgi:uncharacterized Ntn-hydrolase superfamily protein